ncbi:mitochondrial rve superfamily member [Andalucia godoyi]|uniref:Mitochondrial rve superfamily member n=1 Tax=Andalucia godoyi TaxID=505711 RepID=A0A8K0AG40_ANDGO|nr:mitochondrial rve superfamily member [Andalucia godoyi]|eukprot:ANDGO_07786.mRNA.1 mitochondrial rve superfamily member
MTQESPDSESSPEIKSNAAQNAEANAAEPARDLSEDPSIFSTSAWKDACRGPFADAEKELFEERSAPETSPARQPFTEMHHNAVRVPSLKRRGTQAVATASSDTSVPNQLTKRIMPDDESVIPIPAADVKAIPELQGLQLNQLKSKKRLSLDAAKEVREMKRARKVQENDAARMLTMQAAVRETLAKAALAEGERKEAVEKAKENLAQTPIKPTGVVSQEDRKIIWNQINFMGTRASEVAKMLEKNINTVRSAWRSMRQRQLQGLDPVEMPLRGGNIPACRKPRMLSEDQLLWSARMMVLDNTLQYKDLANKVVSQFPELQAVNKDHLAQNLQKYLHNNLGFRLADFLTVPVSRNLERAIQARSEYAAKMLGDKEDQYQRAIFIDETPFNVDVHPEQGISLQGCRPLLAIHNIQAPSLTLIAAVDRNSFVYYECYTGGINGATYAQFLKNLFQRLERTGRILEGQKQMIIHDNVPMHTAKQTVVPLLREWESKIEVEQLPPYSPFLNPCEEVFGMWKFQFCQIVREKVATHPAGVAALVQQAANQISSNNIMAAYKHARSFFVQCVKKIPVNSHQILDGIHEGDEKEEILLRKYKEWGIDLHSDVRQDQVEAGTTENNEAESARTAKNDACFVPVFTQP